MDSACLGTNPHPEAKDCAVSLPCLQPKVFDCLLLLLWLFPGREGGREGGKEEGKGGKEEGERGGEGGRRGAERERGGGGSCSASLVGCSFLCMFNYM